MPASLRVLFRERGYAAIVLATLALAVGANLVVFTVVNALWLRPRPIAQPDRVVMALLDSGSSGSQDTAYYAPLGLQSQVRDAGAFSAVAGQVGTTGSQSIYTSRLAFDAVGHPVETLSVTPEYFTVTGLSIHGRDFSAEDDRPGAEAVAIISDRLWADAFNRREDVIGQMMSASPFPVRVIGIAPDPFHGVRLGERVDMWIPHALTTRAAGLVDPAPNLRGDLAALLGIARLRPGFTVADAQRAVDAHSAAGRNPHPVVLVPVSRVFGAPDHRNVIVNEGAVLGIIGAMSSLVLLGGCATLMAIVLVHYERRRIEFAIRLSLGSSRSGLVRRLVAELGWLACGGALAAVLVALWSLNLLPTLDLPSGVNLSRIDLELDWRVAAAAFAATAVTMIAAATLPLVRWTRAGVAQGLVGGHATAARGSLRVRRVMLTLHTAATIVVLVAAGLFVRTVAYGYSDGARFDAAHTLFVGADVVSPLKTNLLMSAEEARGTLKTQADYLAAQKRATAQFVDERETLSRRLFEALRTAPGFDGVALGPAPLSADRVKDYRQPRVLTVDGHVRTVNFGWMAIGAGDLSLLGVPVIAGRPLTEADDVGFDALRPVLVTATFARSVWSSASPVGRSFEFGLTTPGQRYQVVGVVADFAIGSMSFQPAAVLQASSFNRPIYALNVTMHAANPTAMVPAIRQLISSTVPNASRVTVTTGHELVEADLGRDRLGAWFFSGFGLVGLGLGVGGIVGFVAYLAESRRREFGVRIALGATSRDLLRLAVTSGLWPVAIGAALGAVGALWIGKAAESLLVGVSPFDGAAFAGAPILMVTVAAAAGFAAAWRIHRLSPLDALRAE